MTVREKERYTVSPAAVAMIKEARLSDADLVPIVVSETDCTDERAQRIIDIIRGKRPKLTPEYIVDIADWCERSVADASKFGGIDTMAFVQNAELIIDALRAYAKPEAFPDQSAVVPIIGVDAENGEGGVSFPPGWNELPALTRADILKDVLSEILKAYDAAVDEIMPGHGGDAVVVQLGHYRNRE